MAIDNASRELAREILHWIARANEIRERDGVDLKIFVCEFESNGIRYSHAMTAVNRDKARETLKYVYDEQRKADPTYRECVLNITEVQVSKLDILIKVAYGENGVML